MPKSAPKQRNMLQLRSLSAYVRSDSHSDLLSSCRSRPHEASITTSQPKAPSRVERCLDASSWRTLATFGRAAQQPQVPLSAAASVARTFPRLSPTFYKHHPVLPSTHTLNGGKDSTKKSLRRYRQIKDRPPTRRSS